MVLSQIKRKLKQLELCQCQSSCASCNLPEKDSVEKCDLADFKDFDMSVEQSKDDELMSLKSEIDIGDFGKDKQKHYLVV